MPDSEAYAKAVERLHDQGHAPVEPENPYWKDKSLTFEDPDGWRVVIYRGQAFAKPRLSMFANISTSHGNPGNYSGQKSGST